MSGEYLYPARLVFPGRAGWSLWGGEMPDGHDFLLPVGERFAMFDRPEALWRYVRADRSEHVLSRTPGWERLLKEPDPDCSGVIQIRLDLLASGSPVAQDADLIGEVDMIWDLAAQFGEPFLSKITGRGGELRDTYNSKLAKRAVRWAAGRALWNPAPGG